MESVERGVCTVMAVVRAVVFSIYHGQDTEAGLVYIVRGVNARLRRIEARVGV